MTEIRVDVDLAHPPARVWRAFTEARTVTDWLRTTRFMLTPDGRFTFQPTGLTGLEDQIDGEILSSEAPYRMVMRWEAPNLHTRVSLVLRATPAGCRLTMVQQGFLGPQGTMRRRVLQRTYIELFQVDLAAALDRLAAREAGEAAARRATTRAAAGGTNGDVVSLTANVARRNVGQAFERLPRQPDGRAAPPRSASAPGLTSTLRGGPGSGAVAIPGFAAAVLNAAARKAAIRDAAVPGGLADGRLGPDRDGVGTGRHHLDQLRPVGVVSASEVAKLAVEAQPSRAADATAAAAADVVAASTGRQPYPADVAVRGTGRLSPAAERPARNGARRTRAELLTPIAPLGRAMPPMPTAPLVRAAPRNEALPPRSTARASSTRAIPTRAISTGWIALPAGRDRDPKPASGPRHGRRQTRFQHVQHAAAAVRRLARRARSGLSELASWSAERRGPAVAAGAALLLLLAMVALLVSRATESRPPDPPVVGGGPPEPGEAIVPGHVRSNGAPPPTGGAASAVAAPAGPTASPDISAPTSVSVADTPVLTAAFRTEHKRVAGYDASITINNLTSDPVVGWTLTLTLPLPLLGPQVHNVQGAVMTQDGRTITFRPVEATRQVEPGRAVRVTFQVNGLAEPDACTINGSPCTGIP